MFTKGRKPMATTSGYYDQVGSYYDEDAPQFENRYWANKTLQTIRNAFRKETERFSFSNALEIGFGPGVDLIYFAGKYPERTIAGIDVSQGMLDHATGQIGKQGLQNIDIRKGSVEDLKGLFPGQQFDLIYVYFGALNTVEDLSLAAQLLSEVLAPGGKLVITVINKWYLAGMLLPLLKGRTKIAFQRLKETWGGYSPKRHLDSRCYSPAEIRKAFSGFRILRSRGFSITYPAWYQDHIRRKLRGAANLLWNFDRLLNYTPLKSKGEYMLFVLEAR